MSELPIPLQRAVDELERLPGVGPKTAQRLAFHLLRQPAEQVDRLASALGAMRTGIGFCEICCNLAAGGRCQVCSDPRRDRAQLCVVEQPLDAYAIERSGEYRGLYHVLHGVLSPMDGVGPSELRLAELWRRLDGTISEVIIATNPDVEGEATAAYLARELAGRGIRATRPAHGLPAGGELEYADPLTLSRALSGRRDL
ncbi:MAG: recombination mediator RecR [Candidatus Dormibacteria bacterium]